jgi:hypothetical protein
LQKHNLLIIELDELHGHIAAIFLMGAAAVENEQLILGQIPRAFDLHFPGEIDCPFDMPLLIDCFGLPLGMYTFLQNL